MPSGVSKRETLPAGPAACDRVAAGAMGARRRPAPWRALRGVRRAVVLGAGQQLHQDDREQHFACSVGVAARARAKSEDEQFVQPRVAPGM